MSVNPIGTCQSCEVVETLVDGLCKECFEDSICTYCGKRDDLITCQECGHEMHHQKTQVKNPFCLTHECDKCFAVQDDIKTQHRFRFTHNRT